MVDFDEAVSFLTKAGLYAQIVRGANMIVGDNFRYKGPEVRSTVLDHILAVEPDGEGWRASVHYVRPIIIRRSQHLEVAVKSLVDFFNIQPQLPESDMPLAKALGLMQTYGIATEIESETIIRGHCANVFHLDTYAIDRFILSLTEENFSGQPEIFLHFLPDNQGWRLRFVYPDQTSEERRAKTLAEAVSHVKSFRGLSE